MRFEVRHPGPVRHVPTGARIERLANDALSTCIDVPEPSVAGMSLSGCVPDRGRSVPVARHAGASLVEAPDPRDDPMRSRNPGSFLDGTARAGHAPDQLVLAPTHVHAPAPDPAMPPGSDDGGIAERAAGDRASSDRGTRHGVARPRFPGPSVVHPGRIGGRTFVASTRPDHRSATGAIDVQPDPARSMPCLRAGPARIDPFIGPASIGAHAAAGACAPSAANGETTDNTVPDAPWVAFPRRRARRHAACLAPAFPAPRPDEGAARLTGLQGTSP